MDARQDELHQLMPQNNSGKIEYYRNSYQIGKCLLKGTDEQNTTAAFEHINNAP